MFIKGVSLDIDITLLTYLSSGNLLELSPFYWEANMVCSCGHSLTFKLVVGYLGKEEAGVIPQSARKLNRIRQ